MRSTISLGLAEVVSVFGFMESIVRGTPLQEFVPFGVAPILVIVLDIVPIGLEYWDAWQGPPLTPG